MISTIAHYHSQVTQYLNAGARQFGFMLRGLQELEKDLKEQNIPCVFCDLRLCSVLYKLQRCATTLVGSCHVCRDTHLHGCMPRWCMAMQPNATECCSERRSMCLSGSSCCAAMLQRQWAVSLISKVSACQVLHAARRSHGDGAEAGRGHRRVPAGHRLWPAALGQGVAAKGALCKKITQCMIIAVRAFFRNAALWPASISGAGASVSRTETRRTQYNTRS